MLKDITIFFVQSIFVFSMEQGKAEMVSEVWRTQADGSEKQRLLRGDELEGNWLAGFGRLMLSYDGQKLTFTQGIDLWRTTIWSNSLWTMTTDGSSAREWIGQIPNDSTPGSATWSQEDNATFNTKPKPVSPAWSPDDSKIAFVDLLDAPGTVCVLDVASGQWWTVSEGTVFDWSPDGTSLAVRSNHAIAVTHSLQVVDLDGQVQADVEFSSDVYLHSLDWSSSTDLIVALDTGWNGGLYRLYVIDPYSKHKEVIVEDTYEKYQSVGYSPQWSPNGKMISFARMNRDIRELYVLSLDDGNARLVISQVGLTSLWSPDSRFILTQSNIEGNGLYIISVPDGQYWKIPNMGGDIEGVVFNSYDWLFHRSN